MTRIGMSIASVREQRYSHSLSTVSGEPYIVAKAKLQSGANGDDDFIVIAEFPEFRDAQHYAVSQVTATQYTHMILDYGDNDTWIYKGKLDRLTEGNDEFSREQKMACRTEQRKHIEDRLTGTFLPADTDNPKLVRAIRGFVGGLTFRQRAKLLLIFHRADAANRPSIRR